MLIHDFARILVYEGWAGLRGWRGGIARLAGKRRMRVAAPPIGHLDRHPPPYRPRDRRLDKFTFQIIPGTIDK